MLVIEWSTGEVGRTLSGKCRVSDFVSRRELSGEDREMRGTFKLWGFLIVCFAALPVQHPPAQESETTWWKQERIRFFWGQWQHHAEAGLSRREMIRNVARVGKRRAAHPFRGSCWPRYESLCPRQLQRQGDLR